MSLELGVAIAAVGLAALAFACTVLAWRRVRSLRRGQQAILGGSTSDVVDFAVFHCRLRDPSQDVTTPKVNDHRWVKLSEMGQYKFPDADARTLDFLLESDG